MTDTGNEYKSVNPVGIYLLKVSNRNTRTRCEKVNADWEWSIFH